MTEDQGRPAARGLHLFLPCAAGVSEWLAQEVTGITGIPLGPDMYTARAGVHVRAGWEQVLRLNLHSRLAQRVLLQLADASYRSEEGVYATAARVPWETWFTPRETFRVDVTAHASPLKSIQFAALRVKDAVADRFRARDAGQRPSVDTQRPQVRVHLHLATEHLELYVDTSGEPLFKRGWRFDKGDAPLKETLAASMLAASGWWVPVEQRVLDVPLYDPCCGSGTIVIEAAQMALGLAAGAQRHFAFEHLRPFDAAQWQRLRQGSLRGSRPAVAPAIFGSDVAHRMVDFAQRNAERAGVARALQLRGGDALQRMPPSEEPGVILMNPPYGERIGVAGVAAHGGRGGREGFSSVPSAGDAESAFDAEAANTFFRSLASHWKSNYGGWTAWVLTPDAQLPGRLRLKETRRVPLWNGPIECRLLRFDLRARRPVGA